MSDPVASYRVTCKAAPYQVEGQLESGKWFYFRARHRTIRLGIGDDLDGAVGDPECLMLTLTGFPDDRHPFSGGNIPRALVEWMIVTRAEILYWMGEALVTPDPCYTDRMTSPDTTAEAPPGAPEAPLEAPEGPSAPEGREGSGGDQ